jgi:hypothetical protein
MGNVSSDSKKPGVMIYFEILPVLENLWWWQRFALVEAMIYYARDKRLPKFRGTLQAVWKMVQPIIDRDDERYRTTLEARKRAGKARGKQISKAAKERKNLNAEFSADTADDKQVLSEQKVPQQHMLPEENTTDQHKGSKSIQSTISNPQSSNPNPQSSPVKERESAPTGASAVGGNGASAGDFFVPPSAQQVRDFVLKESLRFQPEDFLDYYSANGWMIGNQPIRDWKAVARRWSRKEKNHGTFSYAGFDLGSHC